MHARFIAPVAALLLAASLMAQTPPLGPATPPARAAGPLITDPPVDADGAPVPIPKSEDPSLTALENAVLAAHDAVLRAIETRDLDGLGALLVATNRGAMAVDGTVILTHEGVLATRGQEFANLRHIHYVYTHRHVTMLSAETALLVGEGTLAAVLHDGTPIRRRFAHSLVFVARDGRWLVAHWHASTPPAKLAE